jgi:hypothetical protein
MMSFDQAVNGVWADTKIPLHFYFIKAMPVTGSRHLFKTFQQFPGGYHRRFQH